MIVCSSCSVQCRIPAGHTGACKRYTNENGKLVRNRALVVHNDGITYPDPRLQGPIITAVGAGTNYPCIRPAPHIVSEVRDGVEVVTTVTEAPLSYSGVTVKLDTNTYIGEEGDPVYRDGKVVGMVNTEEYGSKMIAVGGANKLTGPDGFIVARTIVELANGEEVELSVNKKTKIVVQAGKPPVINGVKEAKMRIGCGSATVGLFAKKMKEAVDEVIVIDHHVTGLFTEHLAGADVGMEWSGVIPNARKSSRGRYFGEHGEGIGGNREKLQLVYQPSTEPEDFERALLSKREQDIRMKMSGTGPHRDDFLFMVGNVDIRKFGSQGQQRTAALSLKLAEIELVRQSIGDEPVLLLDDVLSELDSSRQNYLLDCIKDIQTVITCTGLDEFVNHRFNIDRIFKVTDGTVDFVNEVVG